MKLVENWKRLYRAWTVILPALSIVLTAVIALLQYSTTLNVLSLEQLVVVNGAINVLTIAARYVKQKSVSG